eukprot:scaffold141576_cov22-Tisochrysis_lutea.AAC.1
MDPQVQGVLSSAAEHWPHIAISDSLVMADAAVKMAKGGCVLGIRKAWQGVAAVKLLPRIVCTPGTEHTGVCIALARSCNVKIAGQGRHGCGMLIECGAVKCMLKRWPPAGNATEQSLVVAVEIVSACRRSSKKSEQGCHFL